DEADEVGSLSQSAEALRITASAPTRSTSIGSDYDG
ncbi:MAG: DNA-directed RNA polymerase subunit omega, partial [Allopontixanthobacter sediminis]